MKHSPSAHRIALCTPRLGRDMACIFARPQEVSLGSLEERTMTVGRGLLVACLLTMGAGAAAAQAPTEPARLDIHGDPLPPGAIARLGTVRFRASDEPHALTFT